MKAVVLETKDGYCAVLKDDGTIEKIKMTAEVGQEITMPVSVQIRRFPIRRAAAAAVALVAIASGVMSQLQEYSYVSVDVDASVEYSLNRMDRVISVKALNKKGEELAESVKKEGVQGASLDKAVEKTANVLQEKGYVDADEGGILMSVSSKSKKKSEKLAEKVESVLVSDDVTTAVEKVSMKDRKDAQDNGLSAGRYVVTKGIVGSDDLDEATIDVVRSKSAGDLIQLAEEMDDSDVSDGTQVDGQTKDKAADAELCEEIEDGQAAAEEEPLAPPLAPLEDTTAVPEAAEQKQAEPEEENASKGLAPVTDETDASQAITNDQTQEKEDAEKAEQKDEQSDASKTEVKSKKVTVESENDSDVTEKASETTDTEASPTTNSTDKESTSTTNKTTKAKSSANSSTKSSVKTNQKSKKSE
ncbi:MAG: hypothetical protein IJ682_09580 [Lachnospiraceae bacterium]|nr:hypothetical protein [Lachnospiraceae bacterium]